MHLKAVISATSKEEAEEICDKLLEENLLAGTLIVNGESQGIWTINRPQELPVQDLGDDQLELGRNIDPQYYEKDEKTAEEVIDEIYDGEPPQEAEDINNEAEISRGTTQFTVERLEDQRAEEQLPMDVINLALGGGVDQDRRVT